MPNVSAAATKLERSLKRKLLIGAVCLLILSGVASILLALKHISTGTQIGNKRFMLEAVTTEQQREQGLSNRTYMAQNAGMIFVFDTADKRCMWMKDMHFSLDMIWLDEQGKVVEIKKNIAPNTYPESFCATAKYVIELNAGAVDMARLRVGQHLNI